MPASRRLWMTAMSWASCVSVFRWASRSSSASDPERARAHLALGVELAPEDPVYQFRLGVVFRALGLDREGQSHLDRAKQLEPAGE